jgi:hypothetical protein
VREEIVVDNLSILFTAKICASTTFQTDGKVTANTSQGQRGLVFIGK